MSNIRKLTELDLRIKSGYAKSSLWSETFRSIQENKKRFEKKIIWCCVCTRKKVGTGFHDYNGFIYHLEDCHFDSICHMPRGSGKRKLDELRKLADSEKNKKLKQDDPQDEDPDNFFNDNLGSNIDEHDNIEQTTNQEDNDEELENNSDESHESEPMKDNTNNTNEIQIRKTRIYSLLDNDFSRKFMDITLSRLSKLSQDDQNKTACEYLSLFEESLSYNKEEKDTVYTYLDGLYEANSSANGYLRKKYDRVLHNKYFINSEKVNLKFGDTTYSYYRLPLVKLANLVMQNLSLQKRLDDEQARKEYTLPNPNFFRTLYDGKIFERLRGKLKMEIYMDDAQIAPSNKRFGEKARETKYMFFYLTFPDLPYHWRCKIEDIDLLMMISRSDYDNIKKHPDGLKKFYRPLIDDLLELAKNGIKVKSGKVYFATLSTIIGDNLGIYELFAFSKNFNLKCFICRFCLLPGICHCQECLAKYHIACKREYNQLRKPGIHHVFQCCENVRCIQHVDSTQELPENPDEELIKKIVFYDEELQLYCEFTLLNLSCVDIMHDLLEGFLPDFTCLLLSGIVLGWKNGDFASVIADELIKKTTNFLDYKEGQSTLKYDKFKGEFSIEGNAMQKFELFMKLEIILFDVQLLYDVNGETRKVSFHEMANTIRLGTETVLYHYLKMKKFVLLVFKNEISKENVNQVKSLAKEIVKNIIEMTGAPVRSKTHHITHYGSLIEIFSVLYLYCNLRYEHKHQQAKNKARRMFNFIDPCKTITENAQQVRMRRMQKIDFENIDFFEKVASPTLAEYVNDELTDKHEVSKEKPLKINKNLAIRFENNTDTHWFRPERYVKRSKNGSEELLCIGSLYKLKLSDTDWKTGKIQELEKYENYKCSITVDWLEKWSVFYPKDFIYEDGWTYEERLMLKVLRKSLKKQWLNMESFKPKEVAKITYYLSQWIY